MIKRIILLIIVVMLSLSAPALAAESETGTIEGRIVNGTVEGSSVIGQDIVLETFQGDLEVDSQTTQTDADGVFIFENLPVEPSNNITVTANFQGAEYYSENLTLSEGETNKSIEIAVYDSTTNDEAIKIAMAHTVIYIEQNGVKIKEYYLFINESDRTYIGSADAGNGAAAKFTVPASATEIQYVMGLMECCIVDIEGGFAETMPILPGNREIAFSYKMNYDSGKATYVRNVNYPTLGYNLLFEGESIIPVRGELYAEEPLNISDTLFSHLSSSNLVKGDVLEAKLPGLPGNEKPMVMIWIIGGVIALVIVFVLLNMFRRRKVNLVGDNDISDENKQVILTELAELDDAYDNGEIEENIYRKKREETKAQLLKFMHKLKEENE